MEFWGKCLAPLFWFLLFVLQLRLLKTQEIREYFLKNKISLCKDNSCSKLCLNEDQCVGTLSDPYPEFFFALRRLELEINIEYQAVHYLYLLEEFHVLRLENLELKDGDSFYRFFSESYRNQTLIIMPYACKNYSNKSECPSYSHLKILTERFQFYLINFHLAFYNIVFNAHDLDIAEISPKKSCLNTLEGCCGLDKLNQIQNKFELCSIRDSLTMRNYLKLRLGLFSVGLTVGGKSYLQNLTQLTMVNCNVSFFNSLEGTSNIGWAYFFSVSNNWRNPYGHVITLQNTVFEKNFFERGIFWGSVINTFIKHSYHTFSYKNASQHNYAFLVKIENCSFLDYNYFMIRDEFDQADMRSIPNYIFNSVSGKLIINNSVVNCRNFIIANYSSIGVSKLLLNYVDNNVLVGSLFDFHILNIFEINNSGFRFLCTNDSIIRFKLNNSVSLINLTVAYVRTISFMYFGSYNKIHGGNLSFSHLEMMEKNTNFIYMGDKNDANLKSIVLSDLDIEGFSIEIIRLEQDNYLTIQKLKLVDLLTNLEISFLSLINNNRLFLESFVCLNIKKVKVQASIIKSSGKSSIFLDSSLFYEIKGVLLISINLDTVMVFNTILKNMETSEIDQAILTFRTRTKVSLVNCSFFLIRAAKYGSLILAESRNTLRFKNIELYDSTGLAWGGAFYFDSINDIIIENSRFYNSKASEDGGTIYAWLQNKIFIKNTTFNSSKVINGRGGVMCLGYYNNFNLTFSSFINFEAKLQGGAISFYSSNNIQFLHSQFIRGSSLNGGVIFFDSSNTALFINITSKEFSTSKSGGFLFMQSSNYIVMNNSYFASGKSWGDGAIIYIDEDNTLSVSFCQLIRTNSIKSGGVLYSYKKNNVIIKSSLFMFSAAEVDGGAIFFDYNNTISIDNNTFLFTFSRWDGGSIYIGDKNSGSILNISAFGSQSMKSGGVFSMNFTNNIQMGKIFVQDSNSSTRGGVLVIWDENQLTVRDITIYNLRSFGNSIVIYCNKRNQILIVDLKVNNIELLKTEDILLNGENVLEYFPETKNENDLFEFIADNIVVFRNLNMNQVKGSIVFKIKASKFSLSNMTINDCNMSSSTFYLVKCISYLENFKVSRINSLFVRMLNSEVDLKNVKIQLGSYQIFLVGFTSNINIMRSSFSNDYTIADTVNIEKLLKNSRINESLVLIDDSKLTLINASFLGLCKYENSLLKITNSQVLVLKSDFILNLCYCRGAILNFIKNDEVILESELYILDCTFLNNKALYGGAIYMDYNANPYVSSENEMVIMIKRCKFINNKAVWGGALLISNNVKLTIDDNLFLKNSGVEHEIRQGDRETRTYYDFIYGRGGAIYLKKCEIDSLSGNRFVGNKAKLGQSIYLEYGMIDYNFKENNTFVNKNNSMNPLQVEEEIVTSVFYYNFLNMITSDYDITTLELRSIRSNAKIKATKAYVVPRDYFGKPLLFSSEVNDYLLENDQHNLTYIKNWGIYAIMGTFQRDLSTKSLQSRYIYSLPINRDKKTGNLTMIVKFRDCKVGERLTDYLECIECPINTYSFVQDFHDTTELCKSCDNTGFNCYGGFRLTPKPKYWRYKNTSTHFMRCPNPSACLGDSTDVINNTSAIYREELANGKCFDGYTGILCAECSYGYGAHLSIEFTCVLCNDADFFLNAVANFVFRIFFMIYSINKAFFMCLTISSDKVDINEVISNNLIKILMTYLQCLEIIFSFPLDWPIKKDFKTIVSNVAFTNPSKGLSIDCMIERRGLNIHRHFLQVYLALLHPILLLTLCLIYFKIYKKLIMKQHNAVHLPDNIWGVLKPIFLVITMISFIDFFQTIIKLFSCVEIDEGEYRLSSDLSVVCWSSIHVSNITFVALPFTLVFVIMCPVFIFFKLRVNYKNNSLDEKAILFNYGYFYYGLEHQYYYWDFLVLLRKICLSVLSVFFVTSFSESMKNGILLVFITIVVSLYFQHGAKPFRKDKLKIINKLESRSLVALCGSIFIGMITYQNMLNESEKLIAFIFILSLNAYFVITWLHAFFIHSLIYLLKDIKNNFVWFIARLMNNQKQGLNLEHIEEKKAGEKSVEGRGTEPVPVIGKATLIKSSSKLITLRSATRGPVELEQSQVIEEEESELEVKSTKRFSLFYNRIRRNAVAEPRRNSQSNLQFTPDKKKQKEDLDLLLEIEKGKKVKAIRGLILGDISPSRAFAIKRDNFKKGVTSVEESRPVRRNANMVMDNKTPSLDGGILGDDEGYVKLESFKRACLLEKSELFVDEVVSVYSYSKLIGTRREDSYSALVLKIKNLTTQVLDEIEIEIEDNQNISVTLGSVPTEYIKGKGSMIIHIKFRFITIPITPLIMKISARFPDRSLYEKKMALPTVILKFLRKHPMTAEKFEHKWNSRKFRVVTTPPLRTHELIITEPKLLRKTIFSDFIEIKRPYYERENVSDDDKFDYLANFYEILSENVKFLLKISFNQKLLMLSFINLTGPDEGGDSVLLYILENFRNTLMNSD